MKITIIRESVITCPECGHTEKEQMPDYAFKEIYQCRRCKTQLQAGADQCCIFCAYGSVPCPTTQRKRQQESPSAE